MRYRAVLVALLLTGLISGCSDSGNDASKEVLYRAHAAIDALVVAMPDADAVLRAGFEADDDVVSFVALQSGVGSQMLPQRDRAVGDVPCADDTAFLVDLESDDAEALAERMGDDVTVHAWAKFDPPDGPDRQIFMDTDATTADISAVGAALDSDAAVASSAFVESDEVYERIKEMHTDDPENLASIGEVSPEFDVILVEGAAFLDDAYRRMAGVADLVINAKVREDFLTGNCSPQLASRYAP